MGFGFVEAGTVTLKPRPGNPAPRLWRLAQHRAVVNWMGLPGGGLTPFIDNLSRFRQQHPASPLVVGASLASPDQSLDEFRQLAAACAPLADYLALNASCPNLPHGSADTAGTDAITAMAAQVAAVRAEAGGVPVLVKLGPSAERDTVMRMTETALEHGATGIIACNTVPHDRRDLLGDTGFAWPRHDDQPVGGYSGPRLLDIACTMLGWAREAGGPSMPLIGVGGVQGADEAHRMLAAGADLFQLYTGLIYRGPGLLGRLKQALPRRQ